MLCGTISKHLGLGAEIFSACKRSTEIVFSLYHLGVYQTCDDAEKWKLHQDTISVNLDPSILDGLYTVEIHVKVLIF